MEGSKLTTKKLLHITFGPLLSFATAKSDIVCTINYGCRYRALKQTSIIRTSKL